MVILTLVQCFSHVASVVSAARLSSLIVDASRSKKTSPSGFSALSCASDFCAKSSSSVSVRGGAGACDGGGGAGGGMDTGGAFLPQAATLRPKTRHNKADRAVL